jgi:hypothetical protein
VKPVILTAAIGVLLTGGLSVLAADPPIESRVHADALKEKIAAVVARGEAGGAAGRLRTTVTEQEVNGYLAHEVDGTLPAGVVSPSVSLLPAGRVSGRAVVDLDRVRRELGATGVFNPMTYLRGQLPVVGTGVLQTSAGVARLQFESGTVAGVRVPKRLLQQIVTYYSRSERFPAGIGLDDPIALPAGIQEVHVERGQAIVIQ